MRIRSERRGELLAFLREAVPFYERPGGIRVTLWQCRTNADLYIERVEYVSRAAYEADDARVRQDPEMRSYLDRWRAILDGPPEVEVYERVEL
ncbi:MAG: hypothetical protein KF768_05690 [Phycisphaeraceae bacterium]|nr:hypothetical protein [Phycisphaeraceae bacterium]